MNFKNNIATTREQSQRLLDLGLNPATADMVLSPEDHPMCTPYSQEMPGTYKERCIPAWSLSRLLEMMPDRAGERTFKIMYPVVGYFSSDIGRFYDDSNIFENCVDIIEWLIKGRYFNEEYLKHSNLSNTGKEDAK